MRFLPKGQLGRWMAERIGIWQMHILDQDGFASFAKDRGLTYSFGSDIQELWQVGLLKADLVKAGCELSIPGLELLRIDQEGNYCYLDMRDTLPADGLSDSLSGLLSLPCEARLYYHPFRYFVLHHVDQILKTKNPSEAAVAELRRLPVPAGSLATGVQRGDEGGWLSSLATELGVRC